MPTSKPRKPQDRQKKAAVSAASSFKKNKNTSSGLVTLPSGNTVKVQPISITDLLADKIIPDTLTAMVMKQLDPGEGKKATKVTDEEVRELVKNPAQLADMFDVFDRVAARVVIEPVFLYHREEVDGKWVTIDDEDRDDEMVYTDEVDLEDKSFIFQYAVGGTKDLERFRVSTSVAVGELESGESVSL